MSFFILCFFLHSLKNKEHTLHMLVRDERNRTLFLLLTYDYLRTFPSEISHDFYTSKFQASEAVYTYHIVPNAKDDRLYDLICEFQFNFCQRKTLQKDFDILILQPRGEKELRIDYEFDGEHFQTKPEEIIRGEDNKTCFDGLLWAKLNLPQDKNSPKKLKVSFRLKKVYRIKEIGTIVICPFIYVTVLSNLTIHLDYTRIKVRNRPKNVTVKMLPYDGRKGIVAKIGDLQTNDDAKNWEYSISGKKCSSHAVYFVDIYHGKK